MNCWLKRQVKDAWLITGTYFMRVGNSCHCELLGFHLGSDWDIFDWAVFIFIFCSAGCHDILQHGTFWYLSSHIIEREGFAIHICVNREKRAVFSTLIWDIGWDESTHWHLMTLYSVMEFGLRWFRLWLAASMPVDTKPFHEPISINLPYSGQIVCT